MRAYRELFGHSQVLRLAMIAVTTRVAAPMLSLSLLLAVVGSHHSYASGGLVLTGYAAALAVFVPVSGRLVDRFRPQRVLLVWLTGNMVSYAAMVVVLLRSAPTPVLVVCAAAIGATSPPAAPLVRATWRTVVPEKLLQTAFALDAVLNEGMFVSGPLLVSALLLITSPVVVIIVVGVCMSAGVALLVNTPSVRDRTHTEPAEQRHYLGPLVHGQVRLLLLILLCDTLAFGGMIVGVPAAATAAGAQAVAGVLLSIGSLGAVISALIYGTRGRGRFPGRQLAMFHAMSAVILAFIGHSPTLWVFGGLLLAVGLVGGPRDTLHQLVLGDVVPARYTTEAFAWMGSFMWVGYSLGTALAGQLVSHAGGRVDIAFYGAGGAAAVAALLSLFIRPTGSASEGERQEETVAGEQET